MNRVRVSELSRDIKSFLEYKRALGYAYKRAEFTLRSFERFARAQANLEGQSSITLESTLKAWLARGEGRSSFTAALDLGVLRQLCLYRRRRDPNGFVPDHGWAPNTESIYVPHIFSREEISRLLQAATQPHSRKIPPVVVRTLMLILYCTGLRFGEAARLSLMDVDLHRHSFLIRESKGRTRIVPFGADLAREIKRYLVERAHLVESADAPAALFIDRHGRPLRMKTLSDTIAAKRDGRLRGNSRDYPFSEFLKSELLRTGRLFIGVVDEKRAGALACQWAQNPRRYPYYTAFIEGVLYSGYFAMIEHNLALDRNAQADYEQLAYLLWADVVVSNDEKFFRSAFETLWKPRGKRMESAESFAALTRALA